MIRLTSEKAFDALIGYLERRGLRWPHLQTRESYRDYFIRTTKEAMARGPVFVDVRWEYNLDERRVEGYMTREWYDEILTDEEYVAEAEADDDEYAKETGKM